MPPKLLAVQRRSWILLAVVAGYSGCTHSGSPWESFDHAATREIHRIPAVQSVEDGTTIRPVEATIADRERPVLRRLPRVSGESSLELTAPTAENFTAETKLSFRCEDGQELKTPRTEPSAKPPERQGPLLENYDAERPLSLSAGMQERLAGLMVTSREELDQVELPKAITLQAREMLDRAAQLADRGAVFAARQDFLRVMRLISQAQDASLGRPLHVPALLMGLRALEEADDFAMVDQHVESDVHLEGFIASHQTPVLKDTPISELSPLLAIQRYYEYAYQHLALAGNREPLASEALFSLGKIELLLQAAEPEAARGAPKSVAYFNAALTVNPKNNRAANELGVLLARRGRLEEAFEVLGHCSRVAPNQTVLHNLNQVQRRLNGQGEPDRPLLANRSPSTSWEPSPAGPGTGIPLQWVDPSTFARLSTTDPSPGERPLEPIPMYSQGNTMGSVGYPGAGSAHSTPRMATKPETNSGWFGF